MLHQIGVSLYTSIPQRGLPFPHMEEQEFIDETNHKLSSYLVGVNPRLVQEELDLSYITSTFSTQPFFILDCKPHCALATFDDM